MRQPKKKPSIWTVLRIKIEMKIGLRCPECGGKSSFRHYKKCSKYRRFDPLKDVSVESGIEEIQTTLDAEIREVKNGRLQ